MNDERNVCPTCRRGAFKRYRGRKLKNFSLAPLACSKPASFHEFNVIDL